MQGVHRDGLAILCTCIKRFQTVKKRVTTSVSLKKLLKYGKACRPTCCVSHSFTLFSFNKAVTNLIFKICDVINVLNQVFKKAMVIIEIDPHPTLSVLLFHYYRKYKIINFKYFV